MISGMLFMARTENDAASLRLGDVDRTELVRALFEYFEAWAEERGVSLENQQRLARLQAIQERMEAAIEAWESMPDRPPSQKHVCELIDGLNCDLGIQHR